VDTRNTTSRKFTLFVAGEIAKWAPVAKRLMARP
jgi:hypothetical protein